MAMGRQGDRQGELMVMWSEMPRSPGHVFYDREPLRVSRRRFGLDHAARAGTSI
jgi:hypothetical protein